MCVYSCGRAAWAYACACEQGVCMHMRSGKRHSQHCAGELGPPAGEKNQPLSGPFLGEASVVSLPSLQVLPLGQIGKSWPREGQKLPSSCPAAALGEVLGSR